MSSEDQLQRTVFRWVQAVDDENPEHASKPVKYHATITSPDIASKYGVPEDVFMHYIKLEIEKEDSCRSLPFTLLMVVSYTAMVLGHDPIIPVNAVEEAITFDIEENANFAFTSDYIGHKAIYDVNSLTDFWSWMQQGLAPLMFIQSRSVGESRDVTDPQVAEYLNVSVPTGDRQFLLNFNRIIGGIRLKQERGKYKSCDWGSDIANVWNRACVEGSGTYELYPEVEVHMAKFDSSMTFWMWARDDLAVIKEQLAKKEREGWLDARTMKIEITVPTFNANYGVYALHSVNFFFSRGGHIWKRIIPFSTYSQWFYGAWNIIPDIFWFCGLLNIMFTELFIIEQVVTAKNGGGWRALSTDYLSVWNIVDWANVFSGIIVIIGFVMRFRATENLNSQLQEIKLTLPRADYEARCRDLVQSLEDELWHANLFRILLGAYPMLIVSRLFKSFAHQPRLSIVAKTLASSASDIAHFLLVFLSVFLTFAVAGVIVFGRSLADFTRFVLAVNACFRAMMGDFNWDDYIIIGRAEAFLWFAGFEIGIVLLLLNMLLAIVMDAYSEQKALIGDSDTLWKELKTAVIRWRGQHRGDRRSLKELYRAVRVMRRNDAFRTVMTKPGRVNDVLVSAPSMGKPRLKHGSETDIFQYEEFKLITVENLVEECDLMNKEQALEVIEAAILFFHAQTKQDTNHEEMHRIIRKVDYNTTKLKRTYQAAIKEEDAATQTPDFSRELAHARKELRHAHNSIGDESLDVDDGSAVKRSNKKANQSQMEWVGQVNVIQLTSLAEAEDPAVKCVLEDPDVVLDACRECGIAEDHDHLRLDALGQPLRVMETDHRDDTVLCRIPAIGDIWFGVKALARVEPKVSDYKHYFGQYHHHLTAKETAVQELPSSNTGEDNAHMTAQEEAFQKIHDLEAELRIGRQTVSEASNAVVQLEENKHDEQIKRSKAAQRLMQVREDVLDRLAEVEKLKDEVRLQTERLDVVGKAHEEYVETVMTKFNETLRLKEKVHGRTRRGRTSLEEKDLDINIDELSNAHPLKYAKDANRAHNHLAGYHPRKMEIERYRQGETDVKNSGAIGQLILSNFDGHPTVRIFDEDRPGAKIISELPNHTKMDVLQYRGDFVQVRSLDGNVRGWTGCKNVTSAVSGMAKAPEESADQLNPRRPIDVARKPTDRSNVYETDVAERRSDGHVRPFREDIRRDGDYREGRRAEKRRDDRVVSPDDDDIPREDRRTGRDRDLLTYFDSAYLARRRAAQASKPYDDYHAEKQYDNFKRRSREDGHMLQNGRLPQREFPNERRHDARSWSPRGDYRAERGRDDRDEIPGEYSDYRAPRREI